MTCYQRHLRGLFETLDLEYDKVNRKRVGAAIRAALGLSDDDRCPQVSAALKALTDEERDALPARLSELLT